MKLKQTEHRDLVRLIQKHHLHEGDYTFSKKRGLLYIQGPVQDEPFTFFRKKVTVLDEKKQWKTEEFYYLNLPSKDTEPMSWEAILSHFNKWLT